MRTRQEFLLQLLKETKDALLEVPAGGLRVSVNQGKKQYYWRTETTSENGVYIPKENQALALALAQKDYDMKLARAIEKELKAIRKYLAILENQVPEDIYRNLNKNRWDMVNPRIELPERYVQRWQEVLYEGKPISEDMPVYITQRGEQVRSKSEMMIADMLHRNNIPYRYEYPVYMKGVGDVYLDFTTLHLRDKREIHWEHFGLMDDPDYVEMVMKKLTTYEKNGICVGKNLIVTFETRMHPLSITTIQGTIDRFFHNT